MSSRKCPECKSMMVLENNSWVITNKCTNCEWIFLDFGEIRDLTDAININMNNSFKTIQKWDFKRDNLWQNITCSNCNDNMDEREYIYGSWNHINFCRNCGWVYLDKWEIKEIQNFEISRLKSKEGQELYQKIEEDNIEISQNQKEILENIDKADESSVTWFIYWVFKKII